jgi:RNA polymerase sigma-70 factor, ECF subfamily
VGRVESIPVTNANQDERYTAAAAEYGAALERLARAYEFDPEARRDLLQEIHIALWRSLAGFDERCSLRTWVYRVAHNAAASHAARRRRFRAEALTGLEELANVADTSAAEPAVGQERAMERLLELIHRLKPVDRQVMLAYLEGLEATAISEITGLSSGNVATKIHRTKQLLARRFQQGGHDDE